MNAEQVLSVVFGYTLSLITVFFGMWRWDVRRTEDRDKVIDEREKELRKEYDKKIEKLVDNLNDHRSKLFTLHDDINTNLHAVVKANTEAMKEQNSSLEKLTSTQQLEITAVEALTSTIGRLEVEIHNRMSQMEQKLDNILNFVRSKEDASSSVTNKINNPEKLEQ